MFLFDLIINYYYITINTSVEEIMITYSEVNNIIIFNISIVLTTANTSEIVIVNSEHSDTRQHKI